MKPENETAAVIDGQRTGNSADGLSLEGGARRDFLLGAAGGMATLAAGGLISAANVAAAAESAAPLFAYVGCFSSTTRKASGKGISVYRIDPDGAWTLSQTLETVPNPQFITFDRQQRFLYSVHGDGTEVSTYAIDKPGGRLKFLNKRPTKGNNSTHLTPDLGNRYIVIGNGPGVAVFPINPDGSLSPFTDMVPATGEVGPHRNQTGAGPHPHYVSFDPSGRFLVAPDRGTDRVLIYRLDAATGKLAANDPAFARTRRGAGPRHLAFHPTKPWAYVCDELDSTVTAYGWNSERGDLKAFQVIAAQPDTYLGNNSPAEIQVAPSGNFVYV
jgi:6-phosphogluconolactonase